MTRDRLAEILSAQSEEDDAPDDVAVNIDGHNGIINEFFQEVDEIRENIDKIKANIDEVKKKHSSILSAPQTDDVADIKNAANKVRRKLKDIGQNIGREEQKNNPDVDLRICKTLHLALSKEFVEVMIEYHKALTDYIERFKAPIPLQLESIERQTMDQESEDMLEEGASVLTQEILMKTQQARQTFADIEACHDDVMKLKNFMRESPEMFMDMAMLVVSQVEMIHRIGCNVEHAQDDGSNVQDGSDYVQTATQDTIMT